MRGALLSLALCCVGCLHGAATLQQYPKMLDFPPEHPVVEGTWLAVTTNEFELDTNLPDDQARYSAELCMREIAALEAVMGNTEPPHRVPVRIIAIANTVDFNDKFDQRLAALAIFHDGQQLLFLSGSPDHWEHRASLVEGAPATVTHEMSHVVMRRYFPYQPRWFAEGLAEYLASYKWSLDGTQVELGVANIVAYMTYLHYRTVGVADLLSWGGVSADSGEAQEASRYGFAWAFVHYLVHKRPELFQDVMQQIAKGPRGIEELHRELTPQADQLDAAVHAYIKAGEYQTIFLPVKATRTAAQIRRLNKDEIAYVQAQVDAASAHYHGH